MLVSEKKLGADATSLRTFGSLISICCMLTEGTDSETGDRGSDEDAGWIFKGRVVLQKRRKAAQTSARFTCLQSYQPGRGIQVVGRNAQSDGVENTLDIQIHNFGKCAVRVCVELFSPCCASVGKENVNVVGRLLHFVQ